MEREKYAGVTLGPDTNVVLEIASKREPTIKAIPTQIYAQECVS